MDWLVKLIYFSFLIFKITAAWDSPWIQDPGNEFVEFVGGENTFNIAMHEEQLDLVIGILTYSGSESDITVFGDAGEHLILGLKPRCVGANMCDLVITIKQDYEQPHPSEYYVKVTIDGLTKNLLISLVNIDDNETRMQLIGTGGCNVDEEFEGLTPCKYEVYDEDGMLKKTVFKFDEDLERIFKFVLDDPNVGDEVKMATASLSVLPGAKLDYDIRRLYIFVMDLTPASPVPGTFRVLIEIVDIENQPPRWDKIFSMQQFNEHDTQEFSILAVDGDITFDTEVDYKIDSFEDSSWAEFIKIIDPQEGKISVGDIDRDIAYFDKRSDIVFHVVAYERKAPDLWKTEAYQITFLIDDIDDQIPDITILPDAPFKICESKNDAIPGLELLVNDLDIGQNARYTVTISDKPDAEEYTKAFRIVPDNGYQKFNFLLTIADSTLLDYEDVPWQKFSFMIETTGSGTLDPPRHDVAEITFELINWNDERPVFDLAAGYSAEVEETEGAEYLIVTVRATDRDGFPIIYSIPVGMQSTLEITEHGEVKTTINNVFDYERQEVVILYITATDQFPDDPIECNPSGQTNSETVTLTINVIDVNDETPILTAIIAEDIIIVENQDQDTVVQLPPNNIIEATDADKDADLSFEIVWDESRATTRGRRVTSEEFEANIRGFLTVEAERDAELKKWIPKFTIKEKIPDNTPDYEVFDTLIMRLKVTDLDQVDIPTGRRNFATADITINIGDLNDNFPEFVADTVTERTVFENAPIGTNLGRIEATDKDSDEIITYFIAEAPGTQLGKIEIGISSGILTVIKDDIDCDEPPTESLKYIVTAKDKDGQATHVEITIAIIDVNDNTPAFNPVPGDLEIKEEQPVDTDVTTVHAEDKDRDAPNNEVAYKITNADGDKYFNIGETGTISIKTTIDRDNLATPNPITVTVQAQDRKGADGGLSISATFQVQIVDINDNSPKFDTILLTTDESKVKDDVIGTITIIDADEGDTPNSAVTVEMLSVTNANGVLDGYFELSEPVQTGQRNAVQLKLLKPLKGLYGDISLELKATDKGDQTEGSTFTIGTITVVVTKYNFEKPKFIFPEAAVQTYYLRHTVSGPATLVSGSALEIIANSQQEDGKYLVGIEIFVGDTTDAHPILELAATTSPARVNIISAPTKDEIYKVRFVATNIDGIPASTEMAEVEFVFVDLNDHPKFDICTTACNVEIEENDADAEVTFPAAKYTTGIQLDIYYHIQDLNSQPFLIVDPKVAKITINKFKHPNGMDREEEGIEDPTQYDIRIIASATENPPPDPEQGSILDFKIRILDMNDNDPVFDKEQDYAGVINTMISEQTIHTVRATDKDKTDTLIYDIEKMQGYGDVANIPTPFTAHNIRVDGEDILELKLNFRVQANMVGYFDLDLIVRDTLPGGSGIPGRSKLQIYVVTDEHRVDFKFENPVSFVDDLKEDALTVLKEVFDYECFMERLLEDTEEGVALAVMSVHFLDIDEHRPILKERIIEQASLITVISSLTGKLNQLGLALRSFVDNYKLPEDLSELYKTWLIAVAVVMGALITFLIIAFTFKYLGMKKQITRLTGRRFGSIDSQLNRIAAPNTNNHTFDGSNPVFMNNDKKEMPDLKRSSVSSGDSDLYGVENNPVFANNVDKY